MGRKRDRRCVSYSWGSTRPQGCGPSFHIASVSRALSTRLRPPARSIHCLQGDGARGAPLLLVSDTVFPVPHQQWVSFMYSFPNLLPLPAAEVKAIRNTLAPYAFQRLYGPFWHSVIREQAHSCVMRSADRYLAALAGKYHEPPEAGTCDDDSHKRS